MDMQRSGVFWGFEIANSGTAICKRIRGKALVKAVAWCPAGGAVDGVRHIDQEQAEPEDLDYGDGVDEPAEPPDGKAQVAAKAAAN